MASSSELVQLPPLCEQSHSCGVEDVSEDQEQGAGQRPDAEQRSHKEGQQEQEQCTVTAQETEAEPGATCRIGDLPPPYRAQQVSVAQGRLSEVVATEAAKEVIPGAQSCHLACTLENKQGLSSWGHRAPSFPGHFWGQLILTGSLPPMSQDQAGL